MFVHLCIGGHLAQASPLLSFTEESSSKDERSRLYRPTSKLAELAASFKSSRDSKEEKSHKEHRDRERERESRFEPRAVRIASFFAG